MPKLIGLAVPYFSESELLDGFNTEMIEGGAIDLEGAEIRALYNHTRDDLLGRTQSQTLKLWEESDGIHFELDLPNTTTANDTLELIKRGDLVGCSFQMFVIDSYWDDSGEYPKRIITSAIIDEISIVDLPAFPSTWVKVVE